MVCQKLSKRCQNVESKSSTNIYYAFGVINTCQKQSGKHSKITGFSYNFIKSGIHPASESWSQKLFQIPHLCYSSCVLNNNLHSDFSTYQIDTSALNRIMWNFNPFKFIFPIILNHDGHFTNDHIVPKNVDSLLTPYIAT